VGGRPDKVGKGGEGKTASEERELLVMLGNREPLSPAPGRALTICRGDKGGNCASIHETKPRTALNKYIEDQKPVSRKIPHSLVNRGQYENVKGDRRLCGKVLSREVTVQ